MTDDGGAVGAVRPDEREGSATSPVIYTGVAGADKLTAYMHAMHNFTDLTSCSLPNF